MPFIILYNPLNTIGININDASSATATLIYISFNLYGAKMYRHAPNIAIRFFLSSVIPSLFCKIFFIKKYIAYPEAIDVKNINSFMQFSKEKPNILNINGA